MAGVAEEFVDCFVHILSRGTEDAGDFVDGVVHICVEEYRRCSRTLLMVLCIFVSRGAAR